MDPNKTAVVLIEYQNDFTEEQRLAVEKNYPMFSRPMNHGEFLAELGGKEAGETAGRGYTS